MGVVLPATKKVTLPATAGLTVADRSVVPPNTDADAVMLPTVVGIATAFTVTTIVADACAPLASVTEAVMLCVPSESALVERDAPDPSPPSRLELQASADARSPSSASVAVAVNVIELPRVWAEPSAGEVTVTEGTVFPETGGSAS